jgi:seryl-tRNA synthetase
VNLQGRIIEDAAESQTRVDQAYQETQALLREFRSTIGEIQSQREYNDYLHRMVEAQKASIADLSRQADQVEVTRREIVPLMSRMIETLARFIDLDVPFKQDERRARVRRLRMLMEDPETSLAEKFRRTMDAFQTETEYGRSVEAYRDQMRIGDTELSVDMLRVGRVVLAYRSLDGTQAGVWNQKRRLWEPLDNDRQYPLKQGLRVARKELAPDLLLLPVLAPDGL